MRVMVFGKATEATESGVVPSPEEFEAMEKFTEELLSAGILLDGAGLKPSSKGARVRFEGDKRTVIDGPFTETKELVAGYMIWQVRSLEEAIEWVRRAPNLGCGDSVTEIRPLYEAEDFGEILAPELAEQEEGEAEHSAAQTQAY